MPARKKTLKIKPHKKSRKKLASKLMFEEVSTPQLPPGSESKPAVSEVVSTEAPVQVPAPAKFSEHQRMIFGVALLLLTLVLGRTDFISARHEVKDVYRKERWSVTAAPEHAPEAGKPSPTKTLIYWVFKDVNTDESGFMIHDADHKILITTAPVNKTNLTYLEEKNLTEGTEYCGRHVHAFNTGGESSASADFPCTRTLDSAAPVISDAKADSITETSAVITWKTDEDASHLVYYWKSDNKFLIASSTADRSKDHSVTIDGLDKATRYSFLISSSDAGGNEGRGNTATFATLGLEDKTAPVLSNLQTKDVKAKSATIAWSADETTDGTVEFGEVQDNLTSKAYTSAVGITHNVKLTSLKPETTYYYKVIAKDASGNETKTEVKSLVTVSAAPPKIFNVKVSSITDKEALLTWETDKDTQGSVLLLKAGESKPKQLDYNKVAKKHNVKLAGLVANTAYQAALYSLDQSNDETSREVTTFKTIGKTKAAVKKAVKKVAPKKGKK